MGLWGDQGGQGLLQTGPQELGLQRDQSAALLLLLQDLLNPEGCPGDPVKDLVLDRDYSRDHTEIRTLFPEDP